MKIKVKDLKPNPFRRIENYPIDRDKVMQLRESIKTTGFWDNLLARRVNGHFELAYGHHRLVAVKEEGIKEIDIAVRDLDEATMLRIMAEENLDWSTSPQVINETVLAAKEFLDGELSKCATWEEFRSNKTIGPIIQSEPQFRSIKGKGVGQETILKFLGKNWKQWLIQEALATIKAHERGEADRKAVETLPTIKTAQAFRTAVKTHKIPRERQQSIATKLADDGSSRREIDAGVREYAEDIGVKESAPVEPKAPPKFEDEIESVNSAMGNLINRLGRDIEFLQYLTGKVLRRRFKTTATDLKNTLDTALEKLSEGE